MKGLVLDLRFNPGGLLKSAIEVSDRFIKQGVIVSTRGRTVREVTHMAGRADTYEDFPLAVLVNGYSASASEIVAGAVQDHHRGIIVGERTFGKGSVQNVIPLREGKAALKLTTAHYYTPSGRSIHSKEDDADGGLMPDLVLDTTIEDKKGIQELWRRRSTPPSAKEEAEDTEDGEGDSSSEESPRTEEEEVQIRDEQLDRAVDALKVMIIYTEKPRLDAAMRPINGRTGS
jgi:C-terminal processing protease CtpA/Prc